MQSLVVITLLALQVLFCSATAPAAGYVTLASSHIGSSASSTNTWLTGYKGSDTNNDQRCLILTVPTGLTVASSGTCTATATGTSPGACTFTQSSSTKVKLSWATVIDASATVTVTVTSGIAITSATSGASGSYTVEAFQSDCSSAPADGGYTGTITPKPVNIASATTLSRNDTINGTNPLFTLTYVSPQAMVASDTIALTLPTGYSVATAITVVNSCTVAGTTASTAWTAAGTAATRVVTITAKTSVTAGNTVVCTFTGVTNPTTASSAANATVVATVAGGVTDNDVATLAATTTSTTSASVVSSLSWSVLALLAILNMIL